MQEKTCCFEKNQKMKLLNFLLLENDLRWWPV